MTMFFKHFSVLASSTGFLHEPTHDRYCGGHFNYQNKKEVHQPVIAPLLSSLFTLDVRSGDPELFPTLNSAGIAINPSFIQAGKLARTTD